jgi:succinate dehydrogenase flavin-adding protein (antitoxin of CptAB toxin-antitoxin module)
MHELDLLLRRWLDRDFESAGAGQRRAFTRLLELPDPELARLLLAGGRSDDPELQGLVEGLRASSGTFGAHRDQTGIGQNSRP